MSGRRAPASGACRRADTGWIPLRLRPGLWHPRSLVRPTMPRDRPREVPRVVAVEQYGAGPFGTLYLADLGAEIIKIEDPCTGGDVSRYIPPGRVGADSLFFEAFNRGNRSIALDLKSEAGRAVFERLIASADAVLSKLRGDQPERLGLTYDVLGRIQPGHRVRRLTGYGRHGEAARLPGSPPIQAVSGWAALTGAPEGPPAKNGRSLAAWARASSSGSSRMSSRRSWAALATSGGPAARSRNGDASPTNLTLETFQVSFAVGRVHVCLNLNVSARFQGTSAPKSLMGMES